MGFEKDAKENLKENDEKETQTFGAQEKKEGGRGVAQFVVVGIEKLDQEENDCRVVQGRQRRF